MHSTLAWLASGALLLQAPTLDPDLRRALDALRTAHGVRFEASVNLHASAPQVRPDVDDALRFEARAARDAPVQIEHARIDAFRLGERVAWKPKGSTEWRLFTPKRGDADEVGILRAIEQLQTPRELLDAAESRIASCTKATPRAGEEGATVFECALQPDVARRLFASLLAGAAPDVDALTAVFTLRIVVENGQVAQLALEHRLPLRGGFAVAREGEARRGAAGDDDGPVETLRHYRIREIGDVEVAVPAEVKRLFEDAASSSETPRRTAH